MSAFPCASHSATSTAPLALHTAFPLNLSQCRTITFNAKSLNWLDGRVLVNGQLRMELDVTRDLECNAVLETYTFVSFLFFSTFFFVSASKKKKEL
jgi:hypothetical protein